jgi:hypothetical protein
MSIFRMSILELLCGERTRTERKSVLAFCHRHMPPSVQSRGRSLYRPVLVHSNWQGGGGQNTLPYIQCRSPNPNLHSHPYPAKVFLKKGTSFALTKCGLLI